MGALCSFGVGIIYWLIGGAAFLFIYTRVVKNAAASERALYLYFVINTIVSIAQLCYTAYSAGSINPYRLQSEVYGASTGDYIRGLILGPSYLNMMVNAFFAIYFLWKSRMLEAITAVTIICLTASNFGNLIFIPFAVLAAFLIKTKRSFIIVGVQMAMFGIYYLLISPGDANHVSGYDNSSSFYTSGKVKSLEETVSFNKSSPAHFLIGAGIGNFSSQLALQTSDLVQSGKKSRLFSKLPQDFSPDFYANHYQIYKDLFARPPGYHSIREMPSSFLNQLAGEYGFIGILIFCFCYLGYFLKQWKCLSYTRLLLPMLCGFLLFDYLFEYLSVVVFFELSFNRPIQKQENR